MIKISKFLPKSKYEKEAFFKAFFIYFSSIVVLIGVIFYFQYKNILSEKRYSLFLEMKNFASTFKGEKFKLDLISNVKNPRFYELLENEKEFFMYIPATKNDILKISYPKSKFKENIKVILNKLVIFYSIILLAVLFLSLIFAIYTIRPLINAVNILDETIKDIIHDINTPIMSILVNLKLLKSKYKNDEDLERLELAVIQLSNIYKNLKTALKETQKVVEEVNIKDIIEKEIKTLSSIYPDVKIVKNLKPVYIKADKNAVERIIFNILSNAFKYNKKNGYVKIILDEKGLIVENSSLHEIKNPDRLFDRFYKEGQRGIGLGLSIVKKLSQELGWKVIINTENHKFIINIIFRFVSS